MLTKITCEWTTCKHNSARYLSCSNGTCKLDSIELVHVDNQDVEEGEVEYVDGLSCSQYENDCDKPVR